MVGSYVVLRLRNSETLRTKLCFPSLKPNFISLNSFISKYKIECLSILISELGDTVKTSSSVIDRVNCFYNYETRKTLEINISMCKTIGIKINPFVLLLVTVYTVFGLPLCNPLDSITYSERYIKLFYLMSTIKVSMMPYLTSLKTLNKNTIHTTGWVESNGPTKVHTFQGKGSFEVSGPV